MVDSGSHADDVKRFFNYQAHVGWNRDYYDDMNWMALALLRADAQSANASFVAVAVDLMGKIMDAWDTSCCLPGDRPQR